MKNTMLILVLLVSLHTMASDNEPLSNAKALTTFNLLFRNAEKVTWITTKKSIQARFETADVKSTATFDKKGVLLQTIRYYKKDMLPSFVASKLRESYNNAQVWGVTEVSNSNGIIYHVVLQSAKSYYEVDLDGSGNMALVKQMHRGDLGIK